MRPRPGPILAALLAASLFGAATPASKLLLESLPPFQLAGLLYLGAALAVAPAALRARVSLPREAPSRTSRRRLAGAVLAGGVLAPVLLLQALRLASASSVSLLLNLELVATSLFGVALFGEHLGRRGGLGVILALVGGALLAGQGGWPGLAAAGLAALACLGWGLDNQWTSLIDAYTPAQTTLWKGAVAGATNLALGIALAPLRARPGSLAAALAVGAAGYGASIALLVGASQRLGATRAQGIFAGAPFVGAALAVAILGERLGPVQLVAGGCLAAGAALLLADRHAHGHRHEAVAHVHAHRHDDGHHLHAHPGLSPKTEHVHWHRHEALEHAHPHQPDLHHRHGH